jgi:hypothetical protein
MDGHPNRIVVLCRYGVPMATGSYSFSEHMGCEQRETADANAILQLIEAEGIEAVRR